MSASTRSLLLCVSLRLCVLIRRFNRDGRCKKASRRKHLPPGGKIEGVVLADRTKSIDYAARHVSFIATALA